MALNIYDKMGEMVIAQMQDGEKKKFTIGIYTCNALAAFVCDNYWTETETSKKHHQRTLYSFFCDAPHAWNIFKSNDGKLFYDDVVSIKLNTFYKDAITLLKIITKCGYKVTAYYKDINTK